MGTITNVTASGDPIDEVTAVGFETPEQALAYFTDGFPLDPDGVTFHADLERSQSTPFEGNPWVVFWHTPSEVSQALLSITQCFGDLSLVVTSFGAQFLLVKGT